MTTTRAAASEPAEAAAAPLATDAPEQAACHDQSHVEGQAEGHGEGHGHGPHGYAHQKDAHLKRLRRIEGQIRGLQRMIDEDVYCIDILTQVSASTKGLQSFALQLLEEHLRHCVADAAARGGDEIDAKVAEASAAIARMLRT